MQCSSERPLAKDMQTRTINICYFIINDRLNIIQNYMYLLED